jgi:hypothetical protein
MTTGIAVTIGLNSVNTNHYVGRLVDLDACENDAVDMAKIAKSRGFEVRTLLARYATRKHVIEEIGSAAAVLKPGDTFMLSFSGHGAQLIDQNGDDKDGLDETICLYDKQLVDDELFLLFGQFVPGVRILVFSDSCHSGTVVKGGVDQHQPQMDITTTNVDMNGTKYRFLPIDVQIKTYRKNKEYYDGILAREEFRTAKKKIRASILLISGCKDEQYSRDGWVNSLFTSQLLKVWHEGNFKGSYRDFHSQIVKLMPPYQTPNYYRVGKKNDSFEKQRPFTL